MLPACDTGAPGITSQASTRARASATTTGSRAPGALWWRGGAASPCRRALQVGQGPGCVCFVFSPSPPPVQVPAWPGGHAGSQCHSAPPQGRQCAGPCQSRGCRLTFWASPPAFLPSGAACEAVLAPCAPGPCSNGGECKASEDYESFSCVCPPGWQGEASRSLQLWLRRVPGGGGPGRGVPGLRWPQGRSE